MFEPSEEIVDLRERLQLDVRLHLTSYYKAKNFLRILTTATEANYDALFETVAVSAASTVSVWASAITLNCLA